MAVSVSFAPAHRSRPSIPSRTIGNAARQVPVRPRGHRQRPGDGLIGRPLEPRLAPHAVVDAAASLQGRGAWAIDASAPGQVPDGVVALGPFPLQEGLSPPIPTLLPPVGPDGVAPVVPHDGGGIEPDRQSTIPDTPADVHIVARNPESRV